MSAENTIFLFLLLLFPLFILPGMFCIKRAKMLGRNKIIWGISGFIFSYVAVFVLIVLSSGNRQ